MPLPLNLVDFFRRRSAKTAAVAFLAIGAGVAVLNGCSQTGEILAQHDDKKRRDENVASAPVPVPRLCAGGVKTILEYVSWSLSNPSDDKESVSKVFSEFMDFSVDMDSKEAATQDGVSLTDCAVDTKGSLSLLSTKSGGERKEFTFTSSGPRKGSLRLDGPWNDTRSQAANAGDRCYEGRFELRTLVVANGMAAYEVEKAKDALNVKVEQGDDIQAFNSGCKALISSLQFKPGARSLSFGWKYAPSRSDASATASAFRVTVDGLGAFESPGARKSAKAAPEAATDSRKSDALKVPEVQAISQPKTETEDKITRTIAATSTAATPIATIHSQLVRPNPPSLENLGLPLVGEWNLANDCTPSQTSNYSYRFSFAASQSRFRIVFKEYLGSKTCSSEYRRIIQTGFLKSAQPLRLTILQDGYYSTEFNAAQAQAYETTGHCGISSWPVGSPVSILDKFCSATQPIMKRNDENDIQFLKMSGDKWRFTFNHEVKYDATKEFDLLKSDAWTQQGIDAFDADPLSGL